MNLKPRSYLDDVLESVLWKNNEGQSPSADPIRNACDRNFDIENRRKRILIIDT